MWLFAARGIDGKQLARPLLAAAVKRAYALEELPEEHRDQRGKPCFPARPDLHFNLSHSGPLAFCVLDTAPVGVDVEYIRPRGQQLARWVLSEIEYQWFEARGSRWEDFYTLWTLKESLCKCTGRGLDRPARTLSIPLLAPGETGTQGGLVFTAYGGEDWRGAVCGLETGGPLEWMKQITPII